ncbi:MAG TPA: glycosyltransferase [Candidatus Eisenbacteria bacterium]|jgi:glycosyltransferase involved in cell wall biosynthesis
MTAPEPGRTGGEGPPRALIVACGFPPTSDPTSYRWLRFAGGLARLGWGVEVLTPRPAPRFEFFDPALAERISAEVAVHRAHPGIYQPRVWRARLSRAVAVPDATGKRAGRGSGARDVPRTLLRDLDQRLHSWKVPDPTFEWIVPGVLLGLRLLARRRFDLIVSSAAPFSSHVVAHRLHRWSRVPWVADFSDPFADNPFVARPGWRRRMDRALEASWFRDLEAAIVPVPEMKALFLRQHPRLRPESIHVVPYGFDEELLAAARPHRFEGFTIVHTGSFYPALRDPGPFFQALAAVRDLPIRTVHAGVLAPEMAEAMRRLGLEERFEVLGLRPREEVCSLQLGGSCLLVIGNRGGVQLPGKVLDYLGAGRPILALENDAHDIAARMVREAGAGPVVPNEPQAIERAIRQLFDWWRDGSLDSRFRHDGARRYSWSSLERELDRALRGVLAGANAPAEATEPPASAPAAGS